MEKVTSSETSDESIDHIIGRWTMSVTQFRPRALAWLNANAERADARPGGADPSAAGTTLDESRRFQRALYDAGFVGLTWPKEYGGQGLGTEELLAFTEIAQDFVLPTHPFLIGLGMIGPTILELGTDGQRTRYLPRLLAGEEIWCQLFSEPRGGSDLASLQTTARRTESGWVIDGQKVWTSGADYSDFGAILVRTDPTVPKHNGITMLIVDMRQAGVTVRPLRVATGEAPFNEVFFDGVEVPADAVIGEINGGWGAALVMLSNERATMGAGGRPGANPLAFHALTASVRAHGAGMTDAAGRGLAQLYASEIALDALGRLLHEATTVGRAMGSHGSVAKLARASLGLWAGDLATDLLGEELAVGAPSLDATRKAILRSTGYSVAGGSNEIQRNIIGERILGLPKDGGIDRTIPFNQLRLSD